MKLFCPIAIEAVEVESMGAPGETRRKGGGGIVIMEDTNVSEDGGDEDEAKPGGGWLNRSVRRWELRLRCGRGHRRLPICGRCS